MITAADLLALSPTLGERVNELADALASWFEVFGLDTGARQAMFIAQAMHESAGLTVLEENLNYSAEALVRTFPTHFNQYDGDYAHHPERIANRAYANRLGNGDENSHDGWRYRGRGIFQITGRNNYRACGEALGIDLLTQPDLLLDVDPAVGAALWYWCEHDLNKFADAGDLDGCSDLINIGHKTAAQGDANGYQQRAALYQKAMELLA